MDSDSDQDEEDIHRSLSVTIHEGRSFCNIGRRVGSECSIIAVECVSTSESATPCSVENIDHFTVSDITSDDDLTESVTFTEDEDTKEPPIKIIRVSCQRQVRKEVKSDIIDDRNFTAEKAMDEEPDRDKPDREDKNSSPDEESRPPPDTTTTTNSSNPTNQVQVSIENEPEVTSPDTMETPSSPVPTSLVTPGSMEATHGSNPTSSVSPGTAETTSSTTPASISSPDAKGVPSSSIPASLTAPIKRETQEEGPVDPIEVKQEPSSDHAVQSCTSNNNLPHGSTHFASELSQCTSLLDVEMILVENLLNTCLAAIENVLPEEYQDSSVLASENQLTEETVRNTLGTEENTNLPGTSDSPVPVAGLENAQSSSAGQLAGKKRKHSAKKTADAEGAVGGSSAENSVSSGDAEESFENKDSDKEAKKKKNRCAVCRKKVGLTGFECRCGGLFCAVHRYSDKHDCTFDYREMGAQEIRRNNPVVVGEKIQKI